MAAFVAAVAQGLHIDPAHAVVNEQQGDQPQFDLHPPPGEEVVQIVEQQPEAEQQRRRGRGRGDTPEQFAFHHDEAVAADRVLAHGVIDEEPRQIEQAGEPAHHGDDVEGLQPKHGIFSPGIERVRYPPFKAAEAV